MPWTAKFYKTSWKLLMNIAKVVQQLSANIEPCLNATAMFANFRSQEISKI